MNLLLLHYRAFLLINPQVSLVGSSSDFCMAAQLACRGSYLNINTHLANSLAATPLSPSYFPGTPLYTPSLAPRPPLPSIPAGGLCGLPPNHAFLPDYVMLVLRRPACHPACTRLAGPVRPRQLRPRLLPPVLAAALLAPARCAQQPSRRWRRIRSRSGCWLPRPCTTSPPPRP